MQEYAQFWRNALAIGWRVAWRLVGSSPPAIWRTLVFALMTAILVWLVAPALGGFGARANDEALIRAILSATVAFAVIGVIGVIGVIVATTAAFTTLLYALFVLWRDVKAKIPQKPAYTLKPDASITQAMYFAVTGVWDKIPEGDFASKVAKALEDFHQIAAD